MADACANLCARVLLLSYRYRQHNGVTLRGSDYRGRGTEAEKEEMERVSVATLFDTTS